MNFFSLAYFYLGGPAGKYSAKKNTPGYWVREELLKLRPLTTPLEGNPDRLMDAIFGGVAFDIRILRKFQEWDDFMGNWHKALG